MVGKYSIPRRWKIEEKDTVCLKPAGSGSAARVPTQVGRASDGNVRTGPLACNLITAVPGYPGPTSLPLWSHGGLGSCHFFYSCLPVVQAIVDL